MRNRKTLLAGLITVVMGISLVGFVGCGSDNNSKKEAATTEQETEDQTETEAEDTEDVDDDSFADDTEEDSTEASTEFTIPVDEDFTLAPGLSESYVDFDNRAFVYNGTKFTLGESTLKELIDAGIPFGQNDINNSGNNVNKNYETDTYTADINDYVTMQFKFANFTDGEQKAEDCVLSYVRFIHHFVPQPDYDADMNKEISEAMLDAAGQVSFSFPTTITRDELLANSSENAEEKGERVSYQKDSEVYMGSSGYSFEFNDVTGQLVEFSITWLP